MTNIVGTFICKEFFVIWKGEQGIYYLSKKEEESTQLLDTAKLQVLQNTDAAFWIEAALYACAAYKEKAIMPQYVQLGAYLRTQLEQHISPEQICVYTRSQRCLYLDKFVFILQQICVYTRSQRS